MQGLASARPNMHMDTLARAHLTLTQKLCVKIDTEACKMCIKLTIKADNCTGNTAGGFYTWRPNDTHVFTLMRRGEDTLVYCHTSDNLFYATPHARLARGCPENMGFLAQYCEDANVPRLLVFDILEQKSTPYAARGERLRQCAEWLPAPLFVVQWAGELDSLKKFVGTLPHNVDVLLRLTDTPLEVLAQDK